MTITLAKHYGMCFGVRDAIGAAQQLAAEKPITILGQLVHNPVVRDRLRAAGAREGELRGDGGAETPDVVITAHGAADRDRRAWEGRGHAVTDTTCPLVHRAHRALRDLVGAGYHPVVVGRPDHVEVRGLTGDFPAATVIETLEDLPRVPRAAKIGIISQTTQPIARVRRLVSLLRQAQPEAEVRFVDTVCQPTKDRQAALQSLCAGNELIIVVGGRHSNNTGQLVRTATGLGARAHHVESPADLRAAWFEGVETVGVTAGTSTIKETVAEVVEAIRAIAEFQSQQEVAP